MAKKSISDLLGFSLFIFDLDNTIYNEEDYLFKAYAAICERFAGTAGHDRKSLFDLMMEIYKKEGRDKLFDKFLSRAGIDRGCLTECIEILRNFHVDKQIELFSKSKSILRTLIKNNKQVFILTNGNPVQQKNKIRSIKWTGLDENITFILANEIEPKPSPAGIKHIRNMTGIENDKTLFIGDSEIDHQCASRGEIQFINIADILI